MLTGHRRILKVISSSFMNEDNPESLSGFWLIVVPTGVTLIFGALLLGLTLYLATLPATDAGTVVALFPPNYNQEQSFNAVLNADGRLVSGTTLASAWLVHGARPGFVERLKQQGAWAVYDRKIFQSFTPAGCFLVLPEQNN